MGVKDWLDGVGEASYLLSVGIFYMFVRSWGGDGGRHYYLLACVCVTLFYLHYYIHIVNYHYLDSKLYIFNVFIIALQCLMVKHMIDYF